MEASLKAGKPANFSASHEAYHATAVDPPQSREGRAARKVPTLTSFDRGRGLGEATLEQLLLHAVCEDAGDPDPVTEMLYLIHDEAEAWANACTDGHGELLQITDLAAVFASIARRVEVAAILLERDGRSIPYGIDRPNLSASHAPKEASSSPPREPGARSLAAVLTDLRGILGEARRSFDDASITAEDSMRPEERQQFGGHRDDYFRHATNCTAALRCAENYLDEADAHAARDVRTDVEEGVAHG